MAASPVTNLGQIEGSNDTEALFLKVFTGRVLTEFERRMAVLPRIEMLPMPPGSKSIQVPYVGRANTTRHEVGHNILTDQPTSTNITPSNPKGSAPSHLADIPFGEREVFIDDPLKSKAFIDEWEQFKSQLSAQQRVARELGRILAEDNDVLALQLLSKAARPTADAGIDWSTSSLPSLFQPASDGAGLFTDANAATDGSVLLGKLQEVSEYFDAGRVPEEDRYVALAPAHYNLLVNNQDLLNRDFGGANGVFSDGTVFKAWGMTLVKSIAILDLLTTGIGEDGDSSAQSTQTGVRGTLYNVNAVGTVAVCWQREAVVGVRGGSMGMVRQHLEHYGGDLLVAKLATGYECLRPKHAAVVGTT